MIPLTRPSSKALVVVLNSALILTQLWKSAEVADHFHSDVQLHSDLPETVDQRWNVAPNANVSVIAPGLEPTSSVHDGSSEDAATPNDTSADSQPQNYFPSINKDLFLPSCDPKRKAKWIECAPVEPTLDIILTVYRRENLLQQLSMIANSTFQPSNVWILQNKNHQNVSQIVNDWNLQRQQQLDRRSSTSRAPQQQQQPFPHLHLLHFVDSDSKYHGRFYIAYMMSSAKYVSIWDDDLSVGPGWLSHVVDFLQWANDTAIVSSNGRLVQQLPCPDNDWEAEYGGDAPLLPWHNSHNNNSGTYQLVDFTVQHHTLRRELLRFYLGTQVHTYATGEDIQLNWALRQQGIPAYRLACIKRQKAVAGADTGMGSNGAHASWKTKSQEPRLWLLCKVAHEGMPMRNCQNCNISQECLHHFELTGSTMRHRQRRQRQQLRNETTVPPQPGDPRYLRHLVRQELLKHQQQQQGNHSIVAT